jgi:tRNA/tmRNA/rRNA uracil-C5-methylase (TrmA/RlmC/RlmD family)
VLIADWHDLLSGLETDSSLMQPEQLQQRLELLDALDAAFGDFESEPFENNRNERIYPRIKAIRTRLEAINAELYQSIRSDLMHGAQPHALRRWIQCPANREDKETPTPGLAYDYRDEVLSGILQLREPSQTNPRPAREMVFYQPTPVRHILRLLEISALSETDVFVDLGSGLGHVSLLVSMLAGVQSLGIEVEAAYVASAQECAQRLHQSRVRFIHGDARTAKLSVGSVFYLYSPFIGSILMDVLRRLRRESTMRPIRICTLGSCTLTVAKESWLAPAALPDPNQMTVFLPVS